MNSPYSRSMLSATAVFAVTALLYLSGCAAHPAAQPASQALSDPVSQASPVPESMARTTVSSSHAASSGLSIARDAKSFTTTGPLVAVQQADVAAERDGRVVRIAVEIGDHVHQGQLLASLDDRTLRVACAQKKAHIAALQNQVIEWQAEEKSGEADLRRATIMRDDKIISQEDWEHVKYKRDETIAEVARYRADEAAAEQDLDAANLQLQQSQIVAPFAGVVGRSSVRDAQEVKTGDVLFWITAMAPLHILFTVPESVMSEFTTGAHLELATPDYPGLRQSARILRVSPVVDPASGSVPIIGVLVHPPPLLKPGMSMQVRLAP